ncbi:hypothetical protein AB6806_23950 [Bosea sp. RCC_152_1]
MFELIGLIFVLTVITTWVYRSVEQVSLRRLRQKLQRHSTSA